MFLLTFLVVNMAPTRRELDNDLFTVSGIVQKYNCTLKRLDFQQEDGFLSSLPLGHNGIEIKRGMTTSSTAIFVPFMTQELRMDGEAVYYGLNALSHNVIMANRKKLKNPNGLFLGVPGSGKSFAAKRELVNVFLATRDRIIVVDPMGEYSPLIKRLGGQVIEIAPDSPHHINPMDIDLSFDEENPMALKADFTETTDNVYRYGLLQKLGAGRRQIDHTLFVQTAVFFAIPLVVAGVYSAFLIGKAMAVVEEFMNIHIATNIGLTIVLFLLVYGSYFLATYLSCKRIVTEQRELEV